MPTGEEDLRGFWAWGGNPGVCLAWELNRQHFGAWTTLHPLSHTGQGPADLLEADYYGEHDHFHDFLKNFLG